MDASRDRVIALARAEGFPLAGIVPAAPLAGAREAALARLGEGRLSGMAWITADWIARSAEPGRFLPGARSVILVALPYARGPRLAAAPEGGPARGRVAAYAGGRDYHRVFETKLKRLTRLLREEFGASARATVDYGPLLERPLAAAAGLGWAGKSTMLLVPGLGPWVLLGAVATDLDLTPGEPLRKSCGSCTRCITACPTGALSPEGGVLDARLCISYHTIENRGPIPRELRARIGEWVFGCDDCLTACPVGAGSEAGTPGLGADSLEESRPALAPLLALDEESFTTRFRGRAILRAKRDGLVRNACVALGNTGREADLPALAAALADVSPLVRGHAAWSLARLAGRLGLPPPLRAAVADALGAQLQREDDAWVREELALALAETAPPGPGGSS